MKSCVSFFKNGDISYPWRNMCVVPCTFSILPWHSGMKDGVGLFTDGVVSYLGLNVCALS